MGLRNPLTDSEAETESAAFRHSRAHPVRAPESLEDVRKIRRRNSDTGVAHGKRHVVRMPPQAQLHFAAGWRVLDGVRHQIQKELPESGAIRHHRHISDEWKIDGDPLRFAEYERGLVDFLHQ